LKAALKADKTRPELLAALMASWEGRQKVSAVLLEKCWIARMLGCWGAKGWRPECWEVEARSAETRECRGVGVLRGWGLGHGALEGRNARRLRVRGWTLSAES